MITYHTKEKSVRALIAVGGVMSNSLLRKRMETYCNEIISNYMWRNHNSLLIMPQVMHFGAAYLQESRG